MVDKLTDDFKRVPQTTKQVGSSAKRKGLYNVAARVNSIRKKQDDFLLGAKGEKPGFQSAVKGLPDNDLSK